MENWAGNYRYRAEGVIYPGSVGEVREVVAKSVKIKALGTRHSFNDIADADGELISLRRLNRVESIDFRKQTVTIQGGMAYGELCTELNAVGLALHNLASLPHISVAGACATGTHGSGVRNKNLAAPVRSVEIVKGDGSLAHLQRGRDESFNGVVVGLGAFGVITRMTLDVEPAYEVAQTVYEGLPLAEARANLLEILSCGYSVSLFSSWQRDEIDQVWVKRREPFDGPLPEELFGARMATEKRHPILGDPPESCTDQLGVPGPWHQRLPHFKLEYTPSNGEELQSEYLVPIDRAAEALAAINGMRDEIWPLLLISEIRTIAGDEFWMSPAYGRDSLAIHFTWKKIWDRVQPVLPKIEAALEPFEARPHWGKLFTTSAARLHRLYEHAYDFRNLAHAFDPSRKFCNDFIERSILCSL